MTEDQINWILFVATVFLIWYMFKESLDVRRTESAAALVSTSW